MKMKLPNGFGSIVKLTGKRRKPFMVRKSISSTEMIIIGYYPKYTDAMQALLQYNNDPTYYDNKKYTFEMCYNALCKEKYDQRGKPLPPIYSASYKRCERLYKLSMQEIRVVQINEVLNSCSTENVKAQTRTVLNQVFKYALRNEIIQRNPVTNAVTAEQEKSDKHQPFTEKELRDLWQNTDDLTARLWLIYIYTGMRPTELLEIKIENIHLDENYMIGGIKTEFGTNRMIPIADCIKPFISDLYNPNNIYLIRPLVRDYTPNKPITYKAMTKRLTAYAEAHNMVHFAHDGRHTCATLLNEQGTTLTNIQLILGQVPNSVAEKIYIHKTLVKMLHEVNKLPHYEEKPPA